MKRKNAESVKELVNLYEKDLEPALKIVNSKEDLKNVKDSSIYEKELATLQSVNVIAIEALTNDAIDTILNKSNGNVYAVVNPDYVLPLLHMLKGKAK